MQIKDIMSKDVKIAEPGTHLNEIARMMHGSRFVPYRPVPVRVREVRVAVPAAYDSTPGLLAKERFCCDMATD
jgi:hypothetical protein